MRVIAVSFVAATLMMVPAVAQDWPGLERGGRTADAAIESLKRLLAVSDDPEIERLALGYLQNKLGDRERDLQELRRTAFRAAWKKDLPFVSKDRMLVLGPHVDTARCATCCWPRVPTRRCATASVGPRSTASPSFITSSESAIARTTARSWLMNR